MEKKMCVTFTFEGGAKQVINMCEDAYRKMLANGGVKANLNKIKSDLGAKEFSFEVFPG